MIGTWLTAHWYIVTTALLAILSLCYTGYGYLNITFFRRLTPGFIYSMGGGFITILPVAIVLFAFLAIELLFDLIVNIFVPGTLAAAHFPQAVLAAVSLTITGLLFGLLIGFPVGIRMGLIQQPHSSSQTVFSLKNVLLFLIGIIYCLLFVSSTLISNFIGTSVFLVTITLYGLIIGILFDSARLPWIKLSMGLLVLFFAVLFAMKLFLLPPYLASIIITSSLIISIFICCFLFGYAFFNPIHFFDRQGTSWKRYILGLTFGWLCGFTFPLLGNLLLKGIAGFHLPTSSTGLEFFSAAIGILIGIGNGEGSRILHKIRRQPGRFNPEHPEEGPLPVFSWKKFRNGILIGSLTTFWASFLFFCNLVFFGTSMYNLIANVFLSQIHDLYPDVNFYIIFSLVFISLVFGLIVGLIVGFVLAYGYVIIYKVEHYPQKRFGQIGLFFGIMSIILGILPSLVQLH